MRIPASTLPRWRTGIVLLFSALVVSIFLLLWVRMGGRLPFGVTDGYQVTAQVKSVQNLNYDSDVRMAGVLVGKVRGVSSDGTNARVLMQFQPGAVPVHQGATVRMRAKTLVEETYIEVIDGHGAPLRAGSLLPATDELPSVQLDDVLRTLDPTTRAALSATVTSLAASTAGRGADVSELLGGAGALGRQGKTALDALNAQSADLTALASQTRATLESLDAGNGDIQRLVEGINAISSATAGESHSLRDAVRALPGVVTSAAHATTRLTDLSADLAPVAHDLKAAAPDLNAALRQVPPVTALLEGAKPSLTRVLGQAPATLSRVPHLVEQTKAVIPAARIALSDINPMLAYLQPYGGDAAAFFSNVSAQMRQSDVNGNYVHAYLTVNEQSARVFPFSTQSGSLNKLNPYPAPGGGASPGPFAGTYSRVTREPR
jgi:phospholipid/cholesterol/gamma-HCH transport system substrate-binding protein